MNPKFRIILFLLIQLIVSKIIAQQITCNNWLSVKNPSDAVSLGDLDISGNQLTVEAFFNRVTPYSPANDQRYSGDLVSKHLNPSDCNYLLRPTHCEMTTTTGFYSTLPTCDITFNKTYHVAMVYNGSKLRFYRNGYLISEINATGNLITNDWSTAIGDIAGFPKPVQPENLNGYINEVRIWQVAKTQAEIRTGMKGPIPNPTTQPGLRAYYIFNSLQNLQGTGAWNGSLLGNAIINATNTSCDYVADSCETKALCPIDFWYRQDVCNPSQLQFFSSDSSQKTTWDFGDNSPISNTKNPSHIFSSPGNYKIQLSYDGSCFALMEKTISLGIQMVDVITNNDTTICQNGSVQLNSLTALEYCWTPSNYLSNAKIANPVANPVTDVTYHISTKVAGANLVVNGDFSSGATGFTSSYRYLNVGWDPGIYFVDKSPRPWHPLMSNCVDHTTGTGNMLLVNGADIAGVSIWKQNINITPNSHYEFSCWVQNISGDTVNPCQLQFYINGLPLGPVFRSLGQQCIWTKFFTEWNSGPLTNVEISLVNQNTAFTGNDFAVDDISFMPIVFKQDSVKILIDKPVVKAYSDTTICQGASAQIFAIGAKSYSWSPASGLNSSTVSNPIATPITTTQYIVTGTTATGCSAKDTVKISVVPSDPISDYAISRNVCNPTEVEFLSSKSVNWNFGDGSPIIQSANPKHLFSKDSTFLITTWSEGAQCALVDTLYKKLQLAILYKDIILNNDTVVCNGNFQLQSIPASEYCWTSSFPITIPGVQNPLIPISDSATYYLIHKKVGNNIITNPDFSLGNVLFSSEYENADIGVKDSRYVISTTPATWWTNAPNCTDHTTGIGNMMLVNGAGVPGVKVWTQTVNVIPNTLYEFSCWVENISKTNSSLCKLQFYINGLQIGNYFRSDSAACSWKQFYANWNSGNKSTAEISIVNQSTDIQGNDFALDDISFAPIEYFRDSVQIKIDKPIVVAMADTAVCAGSVVQLSANGATSYIWSPANGLSDPNIQFPTATINNKASYMVSGKSTSGCIATDTLLIDILPAPAVKVSSDTTICKPGPVQLSAQGGISYSWTPAVYLNDASIQNPIARVESTTLFFVRVKGSNSCEGIDSILLKVGASPDISVMNDTSICTGSSIMLVAKGGEGYKWWPGNELSNDRVARPIATPANTIMYYVEVRDSVGCTSIDSLFLEVLPNPALEVSKDTSICKLGQAKLFVSGALRYLWTPSAGLSSNNSDTPIASPTSSTLYTVSGTDIHGCTGTKDVLVNIIPDPVISMIQDTAICSGSSVQLWAAGGASYQWTPSNTLNNSDVSKPLASPLSNVVYFVEVKDMYGCTATDSVRISLVSAAGFGVKNNLVSGCTGELLQLEAFGGDIYSWSPVTGISGIQNSNPIVTVSGNKTYMVEITESKCQSTDTFFVNVRLKPSLQLNATKSNDITCNTTSAQLSPGATGISYQWSPSTGLSDQFSANPIVTPTVSTTYVINMANANGCVSKDSVKVLVINNNDFRLYQVPDAFTPNRDGVNDCFGVSKWGNVKIIYFDVFNRWGEVVFSAKSSTDCWDGTFHGIPQPAGNFVYRLLVETMCGLVERKGNVILIR